MVRYLITRVVNVWRKGVKAGKWNLELLRKLQHYDYKKDHSVAIEAGITCITPMPTQLYTGDEDGQVVSVLLIGDLLGINALLMLSQYEWNFANKDR